MKREQVALAVDAEMKVDVGFASVPFRAAVLILSVVPLAYWVFYLLKHSNLRVLIPGFLVLAAGAVSFYTREGVWIGTWAFYRLLAPVLPWAVVDGKVVRRSVRRVEGLGLRVTEAIVSSFVDRFAHFVPTTPRAVAVEAGCFKLFPGGWRGVFRIEAPAEARHTAEYGAWTESVVRWLATLDVPAQFYAVSERFDRLDAQRRFDANYRGADDLLRREERELVGRAAAGSLLVKHYVVLMPSTAGTDGVPQGCTVAGVLTPADVSPESVKRIMERARSLAPSHQLRISTPDHEEVAQLLGRTPLLASQVAAAPDLAQIGADYSTILVATKLPPVVEAGMVIQAMLSNDIRGAVALFIAPVAADVARRRVDRIRKTFSHQSDKNNDIEAAEMARGAAGLVQQLVRRERTGHMISLTIDVRGRSEEELEQSVERLVGSMQSDQLEPVRCGNPGLWPHVAASPGGSPLRRGLLRPLVTNGVAACLLPAMGTPLSRPDEPYLGTNLLTGMPAYLDVFRGRDNMNLLCIGQMGKGKSVTLKTLLYRHACQGTRVVGIDPHSEMGPLMEAIGGEYLELGEQAVNPLAIDAAFSADEAASFALPSLSVMAGDEKGTNKQGLPIRRLKDEDKGWLHAEVAAFFFSWRQKRSGEEPVISDLIKYLADVSRGNSRNASEDERATRVIERLRYFTQDERGRIFDRPMNLDLRGRSVAFGLHRIANEYGASLTPALAVILSWVLREMLRSETGLIVPIDEAHYVLDDPDVGGVLNRMVRGVRKRNAAVWMASQQVEDFLSENGLGKTMAANAETKIIHGIDKSVAAAAQTALGMSDTEIHAVTEDCPRGRAVVISGNERAVVSVDPGRHLMWMVNTSPTGRKA